MFEKSFRSVSGKRLGPRKNINFTLAPLLKRRALFLLLARDEVHNRAIREHFFSAAARNVAIALSKREVDKNLTLK